MVFTYESVNEALYARHPQLGGWWSSMGWDEDNATVIFELEATGEDVTVTVDRNGTVTAPPELIADMDALQAESYRWHPRS